MINKKYIANDKNGGNIPLMKDERCAYVQIPCGQCEECRAKKAREWQVRLNEEIKIWKYNYFVTLTFSPEELENLCKKTRLKECNAVAGYAVRHMLERWRKKHKKTLKHWLITELGHEGTERIHMHGLFFSNEELTFSEMDDNKLRRWEFWKYGHIFVGDYVSERTINYIVKYINKIDKDHKGFVGQILASPGLGAAWLKKPYAKDYIYNGKDTLQGYILDNGGKIGLPKYYKNKLYNEEERELIWKDFMDQHKTTIAGTTHDDNIDGKAYGNIIRKAQEVNKFHGFGDDSKEWRKKDYNITKLMLQRQERERQIQIMKEALQRKQYTKAEEIAKSNEKNNTFAKKLLKNLEISKKDSIFAPEIL